MRGRCRRSTAGSAGANASGWLLGIGTRTRHLGQGTGCNNTGDLEPAPSRRGSLHRTEAGDIRYRGG
jgi:hypothetical protein